MSRAPKNSEERIVFCNEIALASCTDTVHGVWFSPLLLSGKMNTAEIGGIVKDPEWRNRCGATITALQIATKHPYKALTNSSGEYLLPQLALGDYTITVDAQGFKQADPAKHRNSCERSHPAGLLARGWG